MMWKSLCDKPALDERCTWLYQAVQLAGAGAWSWDVAHDVIELTEGGHALHGLPDGSVLRYREWLDILHADDREIVHRTIHNAREMGTNFRSEYRVRSPDGGERWLSFQGGWRSDDAGEALCMMGMLFDVTDSKQVEQSLNGVLTHMARVSTLGEISAALAHELNQPLAAMLCNAQAALRLLARDPQDMDEVSSILEDIVADDLRAGMVVSRLRGLFQKGEVQALEINVLVEEMARQLRSELITRQVMLEMQLGEGLPLVRGDPVQLRQILLNLVMNALEAMETVEGSRCLLIRTRMHEAGFLEVTLSDSGPGIAPQMLEEIFDAFVSSKSKGLGVGLAISRAIALAHGGRLWAENLPGGGAVLHLALPAAKGE